MKTHLRKSAASGSTRRLIERIAAQGTRSIRRKFVARDREALREMVKGGQDDGN